MFNVLLPGKCFFEHHAKGMRGWSVFQKVHVTTSLFKTQVGLHFVDTAFIFVMRKIGSCHQE